MESRRGFLKSLLVGIISLIGVKSVCTIGKANTADSKNRVLSRYWSAERVYLDSGFGSIRIRSGETQFLRRASDEEILQEQRSLCAAPANGFRRESIEISVDVFRKKVNWKTVDVQQICEVS